MFCMFFSHSSALALDGEYVVTTRYPSADSLMQIASPRPPMPPVTRATRVIFLSPPDPTASRGRCICGPSGPLLDVSPRRRLDRAEPRVSGALACRHLPPGSRTQPFDPVQPPAARMLLAARQPGFRIDTGFLRRTITAAVAHRRIDRPRDVPAGTQHEARITTE